MAKKAPAISKILKKNNKKSANDVLPQIKQI